jgi:2-oxoglutarate ferredoxin oxidoreductase subunit alpha
MQVMYGRHGEAPLPVLAAASSSDCFTMTLEAARIALKYMTPVILLTDGYIGQATEPWRIPELESIPDIKPQFARDSSTFAPYKRDEKTLARMWAIPGMEGMEHRVGGLEKADITGEVSHDPMNHERMVFLRSEKIERIALDIPELEVLGEPDGDLLILSWGSTYGATKTAFSYLKDHDVPVSFAHLKYINPFPKNLGEVLSKFKRVVIPELNTGQLKSIIQAKYLKPVVGINKVQGKPFKTSELVSEIEKLLSTQNVAI